MNRFQAIFGLQITRRSILSAPSQFAGMAALSGAASKILGANERINVAVIGTGGRGFDHLRLFGLQANCRVATVCDVHQQARERAAALVEREQGYRPNACSDMRRVFDDKEIDAVSFATPNHWHALGTVWACQAGKDVYVEKPACHNIWEGRRMIEAARKYGRVVQVGTQSRSTAMKIRAIELLQQGVIGKVYMAKGLCYKWRPSIGHTSEKPVPAGLDWDLFLGPAPLRPFTENRYKYNWHWFWQTGNGDIGNQGVHEMDICRWGLGEIGMPKSVVSTGGKYVYRDDQETPNTQSATFDYGDRQIIFEVRGLPTGSESELAVLGGNVVGNIFFGSEGFMALDPAGFRVFTGRSREKALEEKAVGPDGGYDSTAHVGTFLKAVHSRNLRDCTADIETGVQSAALCHLANISYRLGRKLTLDSNQERFIADPAAELMLTRQYRAPFLVPARV